MPQGGGLSVILFNVYLETILRDTHINTIPASIPAQQAPNQPNIDMEFVDDTDFISSDLDTNNSLQVFLPNDLTSAHNSMNNDKTETYALRPNMTITDTYNPTQIKSIKKLGSYLNTTDDLQQRINNATIAFRRLNNIWLRSNLISTSTRLHLYNAYILPIYTYNLGAVAYKKAQLNKLDAAHRKQLRRILRIFWPNTIHNKRMYERCHTCPISILSIEMRWKLFGHILRLPDDAPPQKSMLRYFSQPTFQRPGRPITTLPIQLDKDLQQIPYLTYRRPRFQTLRQFQHLKIIAQNRLEWKTLSNAVINTYKINADLIRHRSEQARNIPTTRKLNHPLVDLDTPAGMDNRHRRYINLLPPTRLPLE